MNMISMTRRDMLALGALTLMPLELLSELTHAAPAPASNAMRTLDRFIAGYCAAMNAPGLTLGLANAEGPIRVASYGYVDIAAKTPVTTSHLFEIGSITKSFVALAILQLQSRFTGADTFLSSVARDGNQLRRDSRPSFVDALQRHAR
jgi:CubicO group peptidase (beta-lactamase class C family)